MLAESQSLQETEGVEKSQQDVVEHSGSQPYENERANTKVVQVFKRIGAKRYPRSGSRRKYVFCEDTNTGTKKSEARRDKEVRLQG